MDNKLYQSSSSDNRAGDVAICVRQPDGQTRSLLSSKQSYFFLKIKRKRTEDATDICEVEKNGNIIGVTACKFSSECGNYCCLRQEQRLARHFQYSIVEPFGDEIMTVKGYQYPVFCGSDVVAEFTKGRECIGKVTYSSNDNFYRICGSNNETLFTISGPSKCDLIYFPCGFLCSPTSFSVLLPDGSEIGKIANSWDPNNPPFSNGQFGVSFPEDIGAEKQWMLLASSLLLRWQFWRPLNNGIWCILYVLLIITLALLVCGSLYYVLQ